MLGGGGGSLAFLVGMRTGPGCVEIRGVKVSSNLSRLNVLDRLMGSFKDNISFIELYLFERLDLVKPIVICSWFNLVWCCYHCDGKLKFGQTELELAGASLDQPAPTNFYANKSPVLFQNQTVRKFHHIKSSEIIQLYNSTWCGQVFENLYRSLPIISCLHWSKLDYPLQIELYLFCYWGVFSSLHICYYKQKVHIFCWKLLINW